MAISHLGPIFVSWRVMNSLRRLLNEGNFLTTKRLDWHLGFVFRGQKPFGLDVWAWNWVDGAVCRVRCEREGRSDGVGGKEGGLGHHPPSPYSPWGSHHLLPRAIRVTVKSSSLTLDGHWEYPENWACMQLKKTVWVVIDPGAGAASEGCFSCFSFRAGESQPFSRLDSPIQSWLLLILWYI